MGWTEERIELLKTLWKDGWSASQISRKLGGASRSAVLGKIHRLGLAARPEPSRPKQARAAERGPAGPRKPRRPVGALSSTQFQGPGLAKMFTLGAHMCRWPIGDPASDDFTFCGRPSKGVYCEGHRAAAYVPRRAAGGLQAWARPRAANDAAGL